MARVWSWIAEGAKYVWYSPGRAWTWVAECAKYVWDFVVEACDVLANAVLIIFQILIGLIIISVVIGVIGILLCDAMPKLVHWWGECNRSLRERQQERERMHLFQQQQNQQQRIQRQIDTELERERAKWRAWEESQQKAREAAEATRQARLDSERARREKEHAERREQAFRAQLLHQHILYALKHWQKRATQFSSNRQNMTEFDFPEPPALQGIQHRAGCLGRGEQLVACRCSIEKLYNVATGNNPTKLAELLRQEIRAWHPDRFCCAAAGDRIVFQAKATELVQVIGSIIPNV
ncbi:hypothetical protein FQN57_004571 [Myotisia sp. PD_48]|nr:hypothetical protein FQN57_004571 [Myotisia sp. PD_48]